MSYKKRWEYDRLRAVARSRVFHGWTGKKWWEDYEKERRLFGRWLCKEAEKGDREWSPMRYVSQQEIDDWREWKRQMKGVGKLSFYDKHPQAITKDRSRSYKWTTIWEPGYYRVEYRSKPSDEWEEFNTGGFPNHWANGIVKDFEKYVKPDKLDRFLDYFINKELELMEEEDRKRKEESERFAREWEESQKAHTKRWEARERYSRTRGVTPDVETTAFFQALATGSLIK
jgi:hypothetical protein